jgi:hypothetical protein
MKIINFSLIVFIFAISTFSNNVPDIITQLSLKALNGEVRFFNPKGFDKRKKMFGLKEETQVSDLRTGTPVKVYINLPVEFINKPANTPMDLSNYDYEWYCPVLENDEVKLFFIISKKDNVWTLVNTGGLTTLAAEWQLVLESWPYSEGYNPVIIYTCGLFYFHIPEIDDRNITLINTFNDARETLAKRHNKYKTLTYETKELNKFKGRL